MERRVGRRYYLTKTQRAKVCHLSVPANNNGALTSLGFTLRRTLGAKGHQVVCIVPCLSVAARATGAFQSMLNLGSSDSILLRRCSATNVRHSTSMTSGTSDRFRSTKRRRHGLTTRH